MCVIFSCEDRHITYDELKAGEQTNRDGAGMAWIKDGTVHWAKGLNADEIVELITVGEIDLPYVVHFRIATVGGDGDTLTHPFPVTGDVALDLKGTAPSVLFHNGHWNDWKSMLMQSIIGGNRRLDRVEDWSDSRAMAYLVHHHGEGILDFITGGQKIALLSPQGVVRWGDWYHADVKGVVVSNTHYQSSKSTTVWSSGAYSGMGMSTTTAPAGTAGVSASPLTQKRWDIMHRLKITYNSFFISDKESQRLYDRQMEGTDYSVAAAKRVAGEVLIGEAAQLDIVDMADVEAWIEARMPELTMISVKQLTAGSTVKGTADRFGWMDDKTSIGM